MQGSVYQHIQITLAASEVREIAVAGSYLRILSNSITTDPYIQFDGGPRQVIKAGLGIKLEFGKTFGRVTITNADAGAAMTLKIACGDGSIDDSSFVVSGTVPVQPSQSSTGTDAADVATGAAAKVFASATCKSVLIQADFTNGANVFIGFANTVSATRKVIALSPGMAYQFDNFNGDIWAFSVAAQKISVSYW